MMPALVAAFFLALPLISFLYSRKRPRIRDTNPDYLYPDFDPHTVALTIHAVIVVVVLGFLWLTKGD